MALQAQFGLAFRWAKWLAALPVRRWTQWESPMFPAEWQAARTAGSRPQRVALQSWSSALRSNSVSGCRLLLAERRDQPRQQCLPPELGALQSDSPSWAFSSADRPMSVPSPARLECALRPWLYRSIHKSLELSQLPRAQFLAFPCALSPVLPRSPIRDASR